jgi:hypothetical protein
MNIQHAGAHLDHMVRQTRMHHAQLSIMADTKANGLMTIAAVMLTFSAPFLSHDEFKLPVMMLMLFCLATIILAIFTVLPAAPVLGIGKKGCDPSAPGFNLLFFGCFAAMSLSQFEEAMEDVMNDVSKTYAVQVREIYTLGVYLSKKKYRFLRMAYLTFALGLFFSVALLSVSLL